MEVDSKKQADEGGAVSYTHPDAIFVIFNPWCKGLRYFFSLTHYDIFVTRHERDLKKTASNISLLNRFIHASLKFLLFGLAVELAPYTFPHRIFKFKNFCYSMNFLNYSGTREKSTQIQNFEAMLLNLLF